MKSYVFILIICPGLFVMEGLFQSVLGQVEAEVELYSAFSSQGHQAFWLTHNRWGMFDDASANGLVRLASYKRMDTDRHFIDWGAGLSILGRASETSTLYLHEGYLEAALGMLILKAGRFKQTYGETMGGLSSGSTGISRNAVPIPRISISVPEFQPVPLTGGWLEFKAHLAHGWFSNNRQAHDFPNQSGMGLRKTYLHEKSFYLQTGGDSGVKVYSGLVHFAEWGGVTETGRELPDSFGDLLKVAVAYEGGGQSPGVDRVNALGAHYGLWDWGMSTEIGNHRLHLYYQHLFSDGSGLWFRNLRDGFYGIGIENPFTGDWLTGILWEFLYTKHQTGPGLPDPQTGDSPSFCDEVNCGHRFNGRDDYYNNGFYLSGWSYHSRAIGHPFFLTGLQLNRIDPGIRTFSPRYFTGTRIIAHHLGLRGKLHRLLSWKFFASWTRHYGTYWGWNLGEPWGSKDPSNNPQEYFFNPPRHQGYLMFETEYQVPRPEGLTLQVTLAVDRGELFNNLGVLAGVRWEVFQSQAD